MIGLKGTLNVSAACLVVQPRYSHFHQVIDNTGALVVECVNVLKHKVNNGFASVGDEIVVVVNRARPVPATNASR